jgi:hypothetical protein
MATGPASVAVVGASVPPELVLAANMLPVRLGGRPRATPLADAYRVAGLDPPTTAIFEQLLAGDGAPTFVVVGSDTSAHVVLFQTLREIRRVEPARALPEIAFLDLQHLPYRTTARYDRGQVARVLGRLEQWGESRVDDQRLRDAIERVNETRRRLAQIAGLRAARPARVSGSAVLTLVDASLTGAPEPALPERDHDGLRVYLTGSTHEDTSVYELFERGGCVIVGEDHVRGGDAFGSEIDARGDPLDALVEHYQLAHLPARIASSERASYVVRAAVAADADVVVSFTYDHDAATPWDLPALDAAATAAGLRFVSLPAQRFGDIHEEALAL